MRTLVALIPFLLGSLLLQAQTLSGIRTRWSDSFVEWEYFAFSTDSTAIQEALDNDEPYPEDLAGDMKLRWLNIRDDWSEWDFEFGEFRGTIKLKWKNDPSQWELRSFDGQIITMRTAWPGDPTEWRISDNTTTLLLKSRWKNQFDEWLVDDKDHGIFYLYTLRETDPRDWIIEDKLDPSISTPMRLACVFVAVFNSTPRQ